MKAVALLLTLLAASACGEDIGDPAVRYQGTVVLLEGTPVPVGTSALYISFGPDPAELDTLLGKSAWFHSWDGTMLPASTLPLDFSFSDLGSPLTGQGIAVLDIDGDDLISAADLVGEVRMTDGEFSGGTLSDIEFILKPLIAQ